jgi:hypothetical protein
MFSRWSFLLLLAAAAAIASVSVETNYDSIEYEIAERFASEVSVEKEYLFLWILGGDDEAVLVGNIHSRDVVLAKYGAPCNVRTVARYFESILGKKGVFLRAEYSGDYDYSFEGKSYAELVEFTMYA